MTQVTRQDRPVHRRGDRRRVPARADAARLRRAEARGRSDSRKPDASKSQQQLGDGVVRTHRAGLLRRPAPRHEGAEHRRADLGAGGHRRRSAASWTCSAARSTSAARSSRGAPLDPPAGAQVRRAVAVGQELLETGIKVIDLICPFAKGGKVGLFGGAGVGKTVNMLELINNIAKQHCGPVGVRRRRRAHPRGQRLLPRDDRSRASSSWTTSTKSKVAMVYGQMNEPPGNRLRVALTGLTMAEALPRRRARHAVLHRQHLPLHARRHRSVGAARPHAFGGGLPADAGRGNGPAAGAHHLDQDRLDHLDPGGVRAGRRPDRPVARDHLRPPRRHRRAVARHRLARHLSGGRSARLDLAPGRPERRSARSTTTPRARVQATLQRYKELRDIIAILGMDELSPEDKLAVVARAQDPALPVAAVPRGRSVHRLAGQVRAAQGHDQGLQDDRRRRMRRAAGAGVLPWRELHRQPRQVRLAERLDQGLQDDRQRRVRRAARAGVLHGRHDRGSVREGEDAASNGRTPPSTSTSSAPRRRSSPARRSSSCCRARRASSASIRATRRSSRASSRARCASSRPAAARRS